MDWKKIIITILVLSLLIYGGYRAYHYFRLSSGKVSTVNQEIVELLQKQQGTVLTLRTEIAEIEKRVIADTLKETTIVKEGETYEGVKEELIKLRENESENKEEIKALRETFEKRINEFQESPDKIMVTTEDSKVVLYEDAEGNLVSLSEGVEIIRHRKVEPLLEKDLEVGQVIEDEPFDKFSFSLLYDGDISPAISYSVLDWKDLNLNVTAYNFEQPKLGADISYNIRGDLELGAGVGLLDIKEMELMNDFYLRFGIRIEF